MISHNIVKKFTGIRRFGCLSLGLLTLLIINGCSSLTSSTPSPSNALSTANSSLYDQIGGNVAMEAIVDNFIQEISHNRKMFEYFERSNAVRFREKFIEHLCMLTGGPCLYTGDSMVDVHTGMQITEHDFNLGVDLLINAMTKADVSHPNQNKVLAILAKMRSEIIYL